MIRELVLCPRCGADTLVRQDESGNIMEDIPHAPLSYKEQLWPKGHFVRMNEPPDSAKEIRYPVRCTNVLSNKIVYAPQESDGEEYAFARMSVPCD